MSQKSGTNTLLVLILFMLYLIWWWKHEWQFDTIKRKIASSKLGDINIVSNTLAEKLTNFRYLLKDNETLAKVIFDGSSSDSSVFREVLNERFEFIHEQLMQGLVNDWNGDDKVSLNRIKECVLHIQLLLHNKWKWVKYDKLNGDQKLILQFIAEIVVVIKQISRMIGKIYVRKYHLLLANYRLIRHMKSLSSNNESNSSKSLHCSFNVPALGMATRINRVVLCMSAAVISGRTPVLDNPITLNFENVIQHLLTNDNDDDINHDKRLINTKDEANEWPEKGSDVRRRMFFRTDVKRSEINYGVFQHFMPPMVSKLLFKFRKSYSESLDNVGTEFEMQFTDNPSAWYLGVLTRYLLRPTHNLWQELEREAIAYRINLSPFNIDNPTGRYQNTNTDEYSNGDENSDPLAAIHVRRSDSYKYSGSFQPIEKYMNLVEDFFVRKDVEQRILSGRASSSSETTVKRRVFVSTDEISVIEEIKQKYPKYELLYNEESIKNAGPGWKAYSKSISTVRDIFRDIIFASVAHFFVGTLTSNLSRVVYQLRASRETNMLSLEHTVSLDDFWRFDGWVNPPAFEAQFEHNTVTEKELSYRIGDLIVPQVSHETVGERETTGMIYGRNLRLHKSGYYAPYKVDIDYDKILF